MYIRTIYEIYSIFLKLASNLLLLPRKDIAVTKEINGITLPFYHLHCTVCNQSTKEHNTISRLKLISQAQLPENHVSTSIVTIW